MPSSPMEPDRRAYPSPAVAWAAVAVFFLAQIASTIDRGMLALVIDPIRHDLAISEVQIALLQGFAFAVFYVTVGLPIGMLADVVSRRKLLIGGIVIWSSATIYGGLAQNFAQMFASRLAMGCGEAVLGPCAVTMLGDLFPPTRRGRPMALYVLGSMIAFGIGSLVSGYILELAPQGAFDFIFVLRGLAPWRIAFVIVGSCGVLLVILVLLLQEPRRTGIILHARQGTGFTQALAYLRNHWRLFVPFYGALASYALGTSAASGWGAALLIRAYGFDPAHAGKSLGLAQILAALGGAVLGSAVIDRVVRRSGIGGKIILGSVLALLAIPAVMASVAPTGPLAVAMLAEVMFVSAVFGATMLSVMTEMVPVTMKGLSVALYAFVMTMIGGSLGPLAVAALTEHVFGDPAMVGRSMAWVGTSALLLSAVLALLARRQFGLGMRSGGSFATVIRAQIPVD